MERHTMYLNFLRNGRKTRAAISGPVATSHAPAFDMATFLGCENEGRPGGLCTPFSLTIEQRMANSDRGDVSLRREASRCNGRKGLESLLREKKGNSESEFPSA